jgi:hypothetical protein
LYSECEHALDVSYSDATCIQNLKIVILMFRNHVDRYHLFIKQYRCVHCGKAYRERGAVLAHCAKMHEKEPPGQQFIFVVAKLEFNEGNLNIVIVCKPPGVKLVWLEAY